MPAPGPAPEVAGGAAGTSRVRLVPGLATVILAVLGVLLLGQAADLVVLLFIAILIAVYLGAFTDAIVARTGWRRNVAFAIAIIATLLALWGIEALLVPPVLSQVRALASGLPRYVAAWQEWLGRLVERFPALEPFVGGERQTEVVGAVMSQAESLVAGIFPRVFNLVHGVINLAAVAVMALYLARTPRLYTDFVVALTPPVHRGERAEHGHVEQLGEDPRP